MVKTRQPDDEFPPDRPEGFPADPDLALAELRSSAAAEDLRRRNRVRDRRLEWTTVESLLASSVGQVVTAHLLDGTSVSGTVVEIGSDYAAVETANGPHWLATSCICAVESQTRNLVDPGSGEVSDSMLIDVVEDLIAGETFLRVRLSSGAIFSGEALSVGPSLLLRDRERRATTAVEFTAIASIQVAPR